METQTVSSSDGALLSVMRTKLSRAKSALLCVAFVKQAGINLLEPQLRRLGNDARLLVTTAFGSSTDAALNKASTLGLKVRVLNQSGGIYHPKMYLCQGAKKTSAIIGSANLTGGLVSNVEIASVLEGRRKDRALEDAWKIGEKLWSDPRATSWTPSDKAVAEPFDADLLSQIRAAVKRDPTFLTLSKGKENRVVEVTTTGLYVETARTISEGRPPQLVPAWMIQLGWDYLRAQGRLTNKFLLSDNGLNVKRSSAVCAVLARLEGVLAKPGRPIELKMASARSAHLAQKAQRLI